MVDNIIQIIQINGYQMSRNDHHTVHHSLSIISNHHHQTTNLERYLESEMGRGGSDPQFPLVRDVTTNLSEYKYPRILIFIIFNCRNSNAKDADENRKRRCLKAWLICAGILLTMISLAAMIMSIYLLIIITETPTTTATTTTTTTGENKVFLS